MRTDLPPAYSHPEAARRSLGRYGGPGNVGEAVCDESGYGRGDVVDGYGGTG